MKKLYWTGITGLILFEVANVYFIMPLPGSQRMDSVGLAYFLYSWRWVFRALFIMMAITGWVRGNWKRLWVPVIPVLLAATIFYMANFKMAAAAMFKQPRQLIHAKPAENKVPPDRLVIGVFYNGKARAWPVQFLGYHHFILDEVGGKAVLVTYCTVCRTGRVFDPLLQGKQESFRLVGMDHFNAMLEDAGTKSWWQQASGKAVAGPRKGEQMKELFSTQTRLSQWLALYPESDIMQGDPAFNRYYPADYRYEDGSSRNALTGTDSLSWKDKSWVVGIRIGNTARAYDWNRLRASRFITDTSLPTPVLLVLTSDDQSFFAFEIPRGQPVSFRNDTILIGSRPYNLKGEARDTAYRLKPVPAYQEFWHSWQTFNPSTTLYK